MLLSVIKSVTVKQGGTMSVLVYYGRSGRYTSICWVCQRTTVTETLPAPGWVYADSRTRGIVNDLLWRRPSTDELYHLLPFCPSCAAQWLELDDDSPTK